MATKRPSRNPAGRPTLTATKIREEIEEGIDAHFERIGSKLVRKIESILEGDCDPDKLKACIQLLEFYRSKKPQRVESVNDNKVTIDLKSMIDKLVGKHGEPPKLPDK